MTEKRFRFNDANKDKNQSITDKLAIRTYYRKKDICQLLNEQETVVNDQYKTIQHLNKVIERTEYSNDLKEISCHKAQMDYLMYKQKVKETLQKHYEYYIQRDWQSKKTMIECIAEELEVELQ